MRRLRIAVDARPLAFPMVGITRYTHELLRRLIDSPHDWFLYLDRPSMQTLPARDNVHLRVASRQGTTSSTGVAQFIFPRWAKRDHIDVFWSPRHHLPLLLPKQVRCLLTIHDMVWREYPETMTAGGRWLERLLMPPSIRAADTIITVSAATRDDVLRWSPKSAQKTVVIHSGLTLPASSADDEVKVLPEGPYFLFVGTLEPRKNLPALLRAFARVAQENSEVSLVVVGGEGWGDQALGRQLEPLGLDGRVVIAGHADEARLAGFYRQATALVMPSLYEGFGLPLLEAMGFGVPVITSDRGAMAEVAGDAGLLVDPMDDDAIADAMLRMLDKACHDPLADKARHRATQFNWDNSARAVLAEIEKLSP